MYKIEELIIFNNHNMADVYEVGKPKYSAKEWLKDIFKNSINRINVSLFVVGIGLSATLMSGSAYAFSMNDLDRMVSQSSSGLGEDHSAIVNVENIVKDNSSSNVINSEKTDNPNIPIVSERFIEVASDVIAFNAGIPINKATEKLAYLIDVGENCVQANEQDIGQSKKCKIETDGVVLDYDSKTFTATYNKTGHFGMVELDKPVLAIKQVGNEVIGGDGVILKR